MAHTINIAKKPTYDIQKIHITFFDPENQLCYFQSDYVFLFKSVYGNVENRSKILRSDKPESALVEQIVSATIDAGYCGHLVWKTKLTKKGLDLIKTSNPIENCIKYFQDCQQIHLFPSPAGDYYNGTNQTQLTPDIIFE